MILKKESYVIPKDLMEELINILEDEEGDFTYEITQALARLTNEVYKNESR